MRSALLLAGLLLALPVHAFELKPFTASYTADWKQLPVSGTASRQLKQVSPGTWQLDFEASMLVASLSERSTFRHEANSWQPLMYRYRRSGLGAGKRVEQTFDWTTKRVTGSDRGKRIDIPLTQGLLDKSTYQLALQQDVADGKRSMSYSVLDGDDVDTYDFRVLGEEQVQTKAGSLTTIKVERVRDPSQSQRQTVLWFAKQWDFLLVRLLQVEKDGKTYDIMLENGIVDGKSVSGAK